MSASCAVVGAPLGLIEANASNRKRTRMADDNLLRSYRTNDPRKRDAEARETAPDSDPLAELARLIGQTDPFSESRAPRAPQPPISHDARPVAADRHSPSYYEPAQPLAEPKPYPAHPPAQYGHEPHFAGAGYAEDPRMYQGQQSYRDDVEYEPAMPPHAAHVYHPDEQAYDDPPGRQSSGKSRRTLVMAGALVCCAVVGTAAAYGYRSLGKSSGGERAAPVIVADKSPAKIVPAATEQKSRMQERFDVQGAERLVSREEQPLPLPGSPSSRVASLPEVPLPPSIAPVQSIPSPVTTGTTPSSDAQNEPKRVRTVPIRPEGGDASSRPQSRPGQNAKAAPPAPATRGGAPLSLDPAADRAQQRAVTPPAPREGDPQRVASLPPSATGGYLVQLSSQRSESDARASFRGLQQKYPQLKSREPVIRRASVGEKGTYYRAMIGPFGSSGEAEKFCGTLRTAGGQCLIVRN